MTNKAFKFGSAQGVVQSGVSLSDVLKRWGILASGDFTVAVLLRTYLPPARLTLCDYDVRKGMKERATKEAYPGLGRPLPSSTFVDCFSVVLLVVTLAFSNPRRLPTVPEIGLASG